MGQRRLANATMLPLVQDLTIRYRVTHVLWHQGESDFALKTDPARYKDLFLSFVGEPARECASMRRFSSRRQADADRPGRIKRNPAGPTGTRLDPAGA